MAIYHLKTSSRLESEGSLGRGWVLSILKKIVRENYSKTEKFWNWTNLIVGSRKNPVHTHTAA